MSESHKSYKHRPEYEELIDDKTAIEESAAVNLENELESLRMKIQRLKTRLPPDGNLEMINPEELSYRIAGFWLWYNNLILNISKYSDHDLLDIFQSIDFDIQERVKQMNKLRKKENEADFYFIQWILNKLTPLVGWLGESLSPGVVRNFRKAVNGQLKRLSGL